jgi:diacylglycerol kinase family enzyme
MTEDAGSEHQRRNDGAPLRGPALRRATKRHVAFIVHGARAEFPGLRHVVEWVRAKGHTVRPRVTWEPGDGAVLAREAVEAGADTVIACGGDGTINEVVNGLEGTRVALGIIPTGTANDFARQVGIPDDPNAAMDIILRRKAVVIDTAAMNGRRFLNVSSGGIGAEATAETPPDAKGLVGPGGLLHLRTPQARGVRAAACAVRGAGLSARARLPALRRRQRAGNRGRHARHAAGERSRRAARRLHRRGNAAEEFAKLVLRVKQGDHLESEGVRYLQVPWFRITSAEPTTVNLDGETAELRQAFYEARPRDLLVHLPRLPGHRRSVEREVLGGG